MPASTSLPPAPPGAVSTDAPPRRPPWLRYGAALAAVGAAYLLTLWISQLVQPSLRAPLFFAAIAVAAWYGGTGPALAAVGASAVGLKILLGRAPLTDLPDIVALSTVVLCGLLIALLSQERERVRMQLGRRMAELREQARLLDLAQVVMLDPLDRITFWSRGMEGLYGWSAAEAVGRFIQDLLHTELPRPIGEIRAELLARGEWSGELVHRHRDGRRVAVASRWVLSRDAAGRPLATVQVDSDISERRRTEEALHLLAEAGRVLFQSLDVPTMLAGAAELAVRRFADWCVVDLLEEGRFERVAVAHSDPALQPLAEALRAIPRTWDDGTPGTLALRAGHARLTAELTAADHALLHGRELAETFRRLAPASMIAVPLAAQGESLGVWTFARVDPACPYGEEDLPVAEELGRRASQAIVNARLFRASERASAAKDRFLATLSHELRTPLTPVLARVSALAGDPRLAPGLRADLAMMQRNVELEARLIDDLLDLTRVSRGKLEIRPEVVDLAPLIEQAARMCCEEAVAAGRLHLVQDLAAADHRVWGDAARLTQVLWNLFANAVKFTPKGGTVTVRTSGGAPPGGVGGELELAVSDTGIGFEPGTGDQLFRPFEQVDREITRRYGGLGLGLALSRAIVEQHGGAIEASSEGPGRGATFTVRLPAAPVSAAAPGPTPAAAPEPAAAPREGGPLRILLVEDHADTAEAMAALLEASGYRVTVAGSLAEARAATGRDRPDLLISDLGLPDGSGFDLMKEVGRGLPKKGIALSGYGMGEDLRKSREAGFIAHLTKPVTLEALLAAVRKAAGEG